VRRLCTILAISRTWCYRAPEEEVSEEESALRARIEDIVLAFPGYGYRRVKRELGRRGQAVNHKRVQRTMREESHLCQLKRRWVPTTDSRHALTRYPNLIKDLIKDLAVTTLNAAWVAGLTDVRLPRGFASLAAILGAFSRKVVSWALSC
jgi:transposase InsO family protein